LHHGQDLRKTIIGGVEPSVNDVTKDIPTRPLRAIPLSHFGIFVRPKPSPDRIAIPQDLDRAIC
jgi:hypothetical protein